MLIYLDMCCFNRPFDDQSQTRIHFETEAKLELQERVRKKELRLVWSYVLDYENSYNPFAERLASILIRETESILDRGRSLMQLGIKPFDALHVACAINANADFFITTDDDLLRKLRGYPGIKALPPGDALSQVGHWYEN